MKRIKIIIFPILFSLMFLLFFNNVSAGSIWRYEWYNTLVNIPLGDTVENYKKIPYAVLYRDNVALGDAQISIDYNGDWLYYLKNVNTNKVGEYKVWYKAYDSKYKPGTCNEYKCLITFKVRDSIKPTIKALNDVIYLAKDSEYDLKNNVIAHDDNGEVNIVFNTNLNIKRCGEYEVNAVAIDQSDNYAETQFKAVVYDDSSLPIITCSADNNEIYVPCGMDFDIKQYFKAIDEKDGDLTSKINYPTLDNSELDTFSYTVSVMNSSNLIQNYSVIIHVVDETEPVLELASHSLILDYQTDFNDYNFTKHIKSLTDNVSINMNNLQVDHNLENKVGNYYITYTYTDGVYTVSDSIDVSLVSYKAPTISVSDIEISKSTNVDLSKFISITDDSDDSVSNTMDINDNDVDYDKEGTYYATVYCMNSSGLSSQAKFKVIVTSDSIFSSNNIGITITGIVLFIGLTGLSIGAGIFLYKKKKKNV